MVRQSIGIKGYLGERIVRQWLENIVYKNEKHLKIVEQIVPLELYSPGGAFLDFGIIKNNKVYDIYEVKAQDYLLDRDDFNEPLIKMWKKETDYLDFKIQNNDEIFKSSKSVVPTLILLSPPDGNSIRNKLRDFEFQHIIFFSKIFNDFKESDFEISIDKIFEDMKKDIIFEINELQNPKKGKNNLVLFNNKLNDIEML
ncbi:unnamed protein product [marine sediment metagenome]|uniref:Uncharacterized protein n=1 Tax=marine sediment metagenome TaxID=412755 RepID=X1DK70_9ZZZZ